MAKYDGSEQKPKKRGRGGIVALVILLILAGAVGYLYYTIAKAPFQPDDPKKLAASAPMDVQDRFRFSAADGTAQVRLDKADLWTLILSNAGDDFLGKINRELSSYNVKVSGCAINLDEAGLRLDLELQYKDFRLLAQLPCEISLSNQRLTLTPTGVKLGVLPLPVGGLLSNVELEYNVMLPVLDEITRMGYEQDALVVTGTMETDVRTLLPQGETLKHALVFSERYQPLADALWEDDGFAAILAHLEKNPASAEDLYRDLFMLAEADLTEEYLEKCHGLTQRFFPGIDFAQVKEEHKLLDKELTHYYITLEQYFTFAVNEYNAKRLSLSDGVFIYAKKPFNAAEFEYRKFETIFEVLDPEAFQLVLVDAEDGFIRKTSSFFRMADESMAFTKEVDFNKTYILGCVIRSVDAEPYLLYEMEITTNNLYVRKVKLQSLTEAEVTALQEEGKFGVWTG